MSLRHAFEEAFQKGEKIRDQFLSELINSPKVHHLLQNEFLAKSLHRVMNAKDEMERVLKTNLRGFLKNFNLPSQEELSVMSRKLDRLEHEIDGIHRKIFTTRSASGNSHSPARAARPKKAAKQVKQKRVAAKRSKRKA